MRCWWFRRENSHAPPVRRALCARTDADFFHTIGTKGSRREESRIFQNIETPQKYMRNFRKLPVPVQAAHGYPCAPVPTGRSFDPQTPRRPLTPPQLSAPNRSSKNIAEPACLWNFRASRFRKSVRGVLQNCIVVGARANAEGGCGFGIPQPYGGCFRCSPNYG